MTPKKTHPHHTPFGSMIENRSWSAGSGYRLGFNGMEEDDQMKGAGNSVSYEARFYDTRLGRWLSLDPLQRKFPHTSHYVFTRNNPIIYKDIGGTEERYVVIIKTDYGDVPMVKVIDKEEVIFEIVETFNSVKAISSDIVTTITVDLRTGADIDKRYSIMKSTPIRNTGSAAVADQAADAFSDLQDQFGVSNKEKKPQEFGFILVGGGGPGSDWVNGLPDAKKKEILNIGSLLGAAGVFGHSGDINEAIKKLNKGVELTKDMQAVKTAVDLMVDIIDYEASVLERVKGVVDQAVESSKNPTPSKHIEFKIPTRDVTEVTVTDDSTSIEVYTELSTGNDTVIINDNRTKPE